MLEAEKAALKKLIKNKRVLAVVIIGILAVFFGGAALQDETPSSKSGSDSSPDTTTTTTTTTTAAAVKTGAIQPSLAVDFVKWWMEKAFDCNPQTATQSHQEAGGWMTPDAVNTYNMVFWSSPLAKGVAAGQVQAQFVAQNVTALAANPDGTVVVGVKAYVQYSNGGAPITEKLHTDFLVMRSTDGLRIAGIYNHPATATMTTFAPAG